MIINTEWGAFGDNGCLSFIRTVHDENVDDLTINPHRQIFEKLTSDMYLGELVRLVRKALVDSEHLFYGLCQVTDENDLGHRNCISAKFLSKVEGEFFDDPNTKFLKTKRALEDIGIDGVSISDCKVVVAVCQAISTRSAHLCAAGIAALLSRMKMLYCTVGVDGSLVRNHPTYKVTLEEKIWQLLHPGVKFRLVLSEDGSGRGAALVAAVAHRQKLEKLNKENQLQ